MQIIYRLILSLLLALQLSFAGTVAGCGGGALLATTGGTDGYLRAKDGTSGLIAGVTGTAQHYAGADVLNSFDPNHYESFIQLK